MKKRILPLLLSLALCASLTVPALASQEEPYTLELDEESIIEVKTEPGIFENELERTVYYVPVGTAITFIPQSSESRLHVAFFYTEPGNDYETGDMGVLNKDGSLEASIMGDDWETVAVGHRYQYIFAKENQRYECWTNEKTYYFQTVGTNGTMPPVESEQPPISTVPPSPCKGTIDGMMLTLNAYLFTEGNAGSNYVMLRDIAQLLSGTKAQFEVTWDKDKGIVITTGQAYTPVGGELQGKGDGNKPYTANASIITIDGKPVELNAYTIEGNNYFKLRDLGAALGFNVSWDKEKGVIIDSSTPYSNAN